MGQRENNNPLQPSLDVCPSLPLPPGPANGASGAEQLAVISCSAQQLSDEAISLMSFFSLLSLLCFPKRKTFTRQYGCLLST